MALVYVCHPFSGAPGHHQSRVRAIARHLISRGHVPLAMQLYLPSFIDEATERETALRLCLRLVALADEVWVFDSPTEGMEAEIAEAERLGIPVVEADGEVVCVGDLVTSEGFFARRVP